MGDSIKERYDMILDIVILIELVLNLKLSDHVIKAHGRHFNGLTAPMVDLGTF